ncbi:TPA: hypothetical protein PFE75_002473 [Vibrio cholerae]|nr:hypothetical protein [Vibrio cholerae]
MNSYNLSVSVIYYSLVFSILSSPLIVLTRQYFGMETFSRLSFVVIFAVVLFHHFVSIVEIGANRRIHSGFIPPFMLLFYLLVITVVKDIAGFGIDYFYVFALLFIFSFIAFGNLDVIYSALLKFVDFINRKFRVIIIYYAFILGFYKLDPLYVYPYSSFDVEFLPFVLILLLQARSYFWSFLVFAMIIASLKFSYLVSIFVYFIVVFFFAGFFRAAFFLGLVILFVVYYGFYFNVEIILQWIKITSTSLFERFSEVIYAFNEHCFSDYIFGAGLSLNISGEYEGLSFENRKYMHNTFGFLFYSLGLASLIILLKMLHFYFSNKAPVLLRKFVIFLLVISLFKLTFVSELFAMCLLTLALRYKFPKN